MQKLVILLSCLVCLAAAGRLGVERKPWWWQNIMGHRQEVESTKWEISEVDVRERQKFLLNVLLQVQNPVVNREIIELGKVLINDPAAYWEAQDEILWGFLEKCREHEVLGRHEIYTGTDMEHVRQLVGLTKFLTLAKDWPTFQRNVCFARLHLNPIMFVNALVIAVSEREDTRDLVLPAPHEILPQLFYDKDVILTAQNVEWLDLIGKTTTTKPSWKHIVGLGNMWNIISPIHWIRVGGSSVWHPWQVRQPWSPIEIGKIVGQMEVEVKDPVKEVPIVGGPIVSPVGVNWPVDEIKNDDTKILVQSEEKLVIPVEQPHPLSYFTDDVALNAFWNHAINHRLVETVVTDKQHKTQRWGVEKTLPWEKEWRNQGKWSSLEDEKEWQPREWRKTGKWSSLEDKKEWQPREWLKTGKWSSLEDKQEWQPREWLKTGKWSSLEDKKEWQPREWLKTGKWAGVGGVERVWDEKHTNWHPEMTKAERQQWWNEQLMTGERWQDIPEHERAAWKWQTPQEETTEDLIRHERHHGHSTEEKEEDEKKSINWNRLLHVNRRRQNWQRPAWWHKEQNVPEVAEKTWKRWNHRVPVDIEDDDDEEAYPRIGGHWWKNIREGRVVDEEVKPWTNDYSQHTDDWKSGKQMPNRENWERSETSKDWTMKQMPNRENWERPETSKDWTTWEKKSEKPTEEWMKPRRQWIETDEKWAQKTNPWTATIESKQWQNRDVEKKWEDIHSTVTDDLKETAHSRTARSIKTDHISPANQLMNERIGELFIQNIHQLVARLNLEKISVAQTMETKTIEEQFWRKPELLTTSGKLYQHMMVTPVEAHIKVQQNILKLKHIIDSVLEHIKMHPKNPEVLKVIGEILIEVNGEEGNIWHELYNDINAAIFDVEEPINRPTTLSLPSSNLHDPIYHDILTSLNELIWHYKEQVKPYEREQLLVPGIHVDHVEVDDLVTYFDVTDSDLINLVDQQLLQTGVNNIEKLQKQLVARQQRLNHKQFSLGYDITAEQPQRVVVRTFLGPKVDDMGRPLTLETARQHYMLMDAFVENLIPGVNHVERNSRDIVWTTRDTSSISEIYRHVMQDMPMHELVSHNCRFPHRLLLPRGTPSGLPKQLLVVVTPVNEEDRKMYESVDPEWLCGMGIAAMHLDTLPLDFPLDRTIEKVDDFMQPNMLLKDVWIKHDEHVEVPRV